MPSDSSQNGQEAVIFVGTYTTPEQSTSEGVYVYKMEPSTGNLTLKSVVKDLINPSYLAIHPQTGNVFVVHEKGTFEGQPGGGVIALGVDPQTGEVNILNKQSSGGEDPCYISLERTGKYALAANYISGSVSMLPIAADGRLLPVCSTIQHTGKSIHPERQDKPYAHSILPDPTNVFAIACDLGIDKLLIYRMDLENGQLIRHGEMSVKPGSGPRHLTFHPNGRYAYLACELNSTVLAFTWDPDGGTLEEFQSVRTLPPGYEGRNLPADIHISPDGAYLYVSNRGHDSFACYEVSPESGTLTLKHHTATGGEEPRGFAIDPTGKYLISANQNSNNIVTFLIDPGMGHLSKVGDEVQVSMPVCVKFA
ncbi:MAG: lactonase family protein [Bacteroidota bacterium]